MVPVAKDQILELISYLRRASHQPVLIQDEHPDAVANVEQLWSRRVMARPVSIRSHLFQLHDPEVLQPVRQRRTYSRMVLVAADSL